MSELQTMIDEALAALESGRRGDALAAAVALADEQFEAVAPRLMELVAERAEQIDLDELTHQEPFPEPDVIRRVVRAIDDEDSDALVRLAPDGEVDLVVVLLTAAAALGPRG